MPKEPCNRALFCTPKRPADAFIPAILVKIPERAELEERQFELEMERMKGRPAYLEPDDLGVMYGLLLGDIDRYRSLSLSLWYGVVRYALIGIALFHCLCAPCTLHPA